MEAVVHPRAPLLGIEEVGGSNGPVQKESDTCQPAFTRQETVGPQNAHQPDEQPNAEQSGFDWLMGQPDDGPS